MRWDNIQQLMKFQISKIEKKQEKALEEQQRHHEKEKQKVQELIEERRPEFYRDDKYNFIPLI